MLDSYLQPCEYDILFAEFLRPAVMTLELAQLIPQIEQAVSTVKDSAEDLAHRRDIAVQTLTSQSVNLDELRQKLTTARTTWLVAGLANGLRQTYPLPACPDDISVLGVDGSHIEFDRHGPLACYLLNIGQAHLRYGSQPDALLQSYCKLYGTDELVIKEPTGSNREQRIEGPLLGIKRAVAEISAAEQALKAMPPEIPTLAVLDGSLILWGLVGQTYPAFIAEIMLEKGFLKHLDRLYEMSRNGNLSVASYISYPGSTEVVNMLKVALCPFRPPDCDRHCDRLQVGTERTCSLIAGVQDRELFGEILPIGERSEVFVSLSSIVKSYYREHAINFFYLNVGEEIARVEVPGWVAANSRLLDLTHAVVFDQCQRGRGYPVALQEAHEKAVVTGADREIFWSLVTRELLGSGLRSENSPKSHSKRTRWL